MLIIIEYQNSIERKSFDNFLKLKGITISKGVIYLSDGYSFDDGSDKKKLCLTKFTIKIRNSFETFNIYFYKDDKDYDDFSLYKNEEFILANTKSANIVSKDVYLTKYYLIYRNGTLETNYQKVFINNHLYRGEKLRNKDRIDFLSFSFVYFDKFLYIRNYLTENKLNKYELQELQVKYDERKPQLANYYEKKINDIVIDKLEKFDAPKNTNRRKLIFQMGPTLTMSLAMIFVASINIYNSYLSDGKLISMIALIMMPLTMLLSGVMWPILSNHDEKRSYKKEYEDAKKEYLDYLKTYENKINKSIKEYLSGIREYEFCVEDIKNRLFYLTKASKYFLTLSLGLQTKRMEFEIEEVGDKDIDEKLNKLKYQLNNINNAPLLLDLKSNKRISIISDNKKYLLNKILLELCYKYHYNDLNIAIYSKDLSIFKDKEYLPHLFFKSERLTLTNEREIHNLNSYQLEKPLVVLLNSYTDVLFDNDKIISILFTDDRDIILKDSNAIIEYRDKGYLYSDGIKEFKYDIDPIDFSYYYRYISLFLSSKEVSKYEFFRDLIPGLNIESYYLNRPIGLRADFAYINNEILSFDLHERKDGPHGLIGGSTGSGKSELIISLLLSLALRYPPDYLNIILIDYKGGGIKESLSYQNISIPHIVASISNLEEDAFERLMVAIKRECKERQNKFSKLSKVAETSIMNLDEYLDLYSEYGFEKIGHLLIVVDEFAELKKENPYLIKELVSISRIGRSLGLHLILATQKPGGVIDEEIFSNAHFKIALKLMNEKDSLDIIKNKEAAYLKNPGEFYLKVDDSLIKAKSLYSKKDIDGKDAYEVALLDNRLNVISKRIKKNTDIKLESEFLVKRIIDTSNMLNLKSRQLEFIRPLNLSYQDLNDKYQTINNLVMGEVDDYLNARKEILTYSFLNNLLIYSSRPKEIKNILNQLNDNKLASVIIGKQRYAGGYIRDSILYEDEEDILFLFNKLLNDKNTNLHIIIEDLNTLLSYSEHYLEILFNLIRRSAVSNYVFYILSNNSNINFKLLNSIKDKLAIDIYDKQDVINMFSSKGEYVGSSYYFDESVISFVPCKIDEYKFIEPMVDSYIEKIPEYVEYEEKRSGILIGYDLLSRKKLVLALNERLLITGFNKTLLDTFKKYYGSLSNVDVIKYSNELIEKEYDGVLWLGEKIFSQRIFYVDRVDHLNNNEAYYYTNNHLRKIRTIDYE